MGKWGLKVSDILWFTYLFHDFKVNPLLNK